MGAYYCELESSDPSIRSNGKITSCFKTIIELGCKRKFISGFYAVSFVSFVYFCYVYEFSLFQIQQETNRMHLSRPKPLSWSGASMHSDDEYSTTEAPHLNYFNENPACHLPTLKPFDESILKFVETPEPLNCSEVPEEKAKSKFKFKYNLLFEIRNNSNLIMLQDVRTFGFDFCCYENFTREKENSITNGGSCTPIISPVTSIPVEHEFIIVYCIPIHIDVSSNSSTSKAPPKLKPVDMFHLVRLKTDVEDRLRTISNRATDQVNVLVIGLDSVSHMNFIRTMPKTYEYLTQDLNGIGMSGYTKVGDNTFPNMAPALMGLSVAELAPICWNSSLGQFFDKCPFIWKIFSQEGYRTSYAEDAAWMGIFNYLKKGFDKQPTDYYLRTLTYTMAELMGHTRSTSLCYGPRLAFSILLNNVKNMVEAMGKERRYFQFTWATSLFHDFLNLPVLGDIYFRDTLKWLKEEGHLENTVLALMSDHGIRFGAIRETFQGKVEERMPFLYYSFPKWFSEKYRSAVSNMKFNRNRLTTPFDFYETLKDLLHLKNITDELVKARHQVLSNQLATGTQPRGLSLFVPIPSNRNCESAGIEQHYCVCHEMESVSVTDSLVQEAASAVVTQLNKMLLPFAQCSKLSLKEVSSAQAMQMSVNKTDAKVFSDIKPTTYSVTLVTVPGGSIFEATLSVTQGIQRLWTLSGGISRINSYGTQSRCVSEYGMKMYCFCQ